ncbi:hypothetical protein [Shewanella sp. FJAT-52076]|uniref:hypothetical protein n=1 Tax=Shewanella sp. FJAT-52076 TaxID=2864202 RepID=UPI001C656580|nr:hypothetical protein [Shewanella sp. FJAT-52076]QYJ74459.1 hypothetical protein K0H79_13985 [Shewanella sp. FJAT-52076]
MSFFKSLFGDKSVPPRVIKHPKELKKSDIISLDNDFGLPQQLRGQSLEVIAVNTYEFERSQETEWQLKGAGGDTLYMSLVDDDEPALCFSLKIQRSDVETLFDLDAFSDIFEEDCKASLSTQQVPSHLEQWVANQYHEVVFAQFGYFHREDYRGLKPPQDANGATGEPFERYLLEDTSETYSVEVEVYEGGETDVLVGLTKPLGIIREYWPGTPS